MINLPIVIEGKAHLFTEYAKMILYLLNFHSFNISSLKTISKKKKSKGNKLLHKIK
jgi:hypothetical protein